MDIEKIFNDLESNQMQECEEAKKKLVDLFMQNKEQWLVHNMMDYFLKTGSLRIMEVLVKVQAPHDVFIFDRLSEWLKNPSHRVQALNLFCFVVRKHPTWLFKVEKHRLFRDIFKLLATEKEIVPLMSALLCIITLLPIIPNLVPNFLNELFDVFGHLASWNCQNPNRLTDDKLVHLQLGLQMLFHRLYGMYPWNFLAYISEFIKKEKGAIFHHTIKPLLETVRVHPMLVTASTDTELSSTRWKEMEPHDVVVECAKLSLPVTHQDLSTDQASMNLAASDWFDTPGALPTPSNNTKRNFSVSSSHQIKESQQHASSRFDCGVSSASRDVIWSPFNEINNFGAIPLTPTPSYVLQLGCSTSTSLNNQLLSLTGSSPPEAAVEATPETTPMKDVNDYKQRALPLSGSNITNPHAVRVILSSQPSSPMRKDHQFNFPEVVLDSASTTTFVEQQITKQPLTRVTTLHDRMVQQMMHDRNSPLAFQSCSSEVYPLQSVDAENQMSAQLNYKYETAECSLNQSTVPNYKLMNQNPCVEHISKGCDDCDETERTMCTAGGLHIPTSRSMQLLAKGIKRRNRMTSYCYNEYSCEKIGANSLASAEFGSKLIETAKVRRTKSCSAICLATPKTFTDLSDAETDEKLSKNERRLQKSGKMLAIASARQIVKPVSTTSLATRITQTIQTWPQNYESTLFEMFVQDNRLRSVHECNILFPQEILDQYIVRTIKAKENFDAGYRMDQEQFQLLCLQLQYERYRREIHAERNRRLMGRSRDKRSLEMERDRLREQLKNFATKNEELMRQIDETTKVANERQDMYLEELVGLKTMYQNEMEQNKCLRHANENLQARLNEEFANRKDMNYELESLRGQIFNMNTECQHAQIQAEIGLQCKQELAHLEAEFVVMGEVQIKCRDRLAEMDNYRARDEELTMLQDSFSIELKELKHLLEEKSSQFDSARHKISDLQSQLLNSEKVITEQKRLLRTVKDEYEEKFKVLNKKYEVQKTIILQMEEKILSLHKTQAPVAISACSPDTEKTDIASSMDRNSPLSTSLASSESLSASLRSTELRNLQQLVETPLCDSGSISNTLDGERASGLDLAASVITVSSAAGKTSGLSSGSSAHTFELPKSSTSVNQPAIHPHLHLQQQKHSSAATHPAATHHHKF